MKKFVSMAMVAAMTTSMVPATAFAGVGDVEATAKIVDAWTVNKLFGKEVEGTEGLIAGSYKSVPELQIKITETNYKKTMDGQTPVAEITVALDNAELTSEFSVEDNIGVRLDGDNVITNADVAAAQDVVDAAQEKYDAAEAAADKAEADLKAKAEELGLKPEGDELEAAKKALTEAKVNKGLADAAVPTAESAYNSAKTTADSLQTAYDAAAAKYQEALDAADPSTTEGKALAAAQAELKTAQDNLTAATAAADKAKEADDAAAAEVTAATTAKTAATTAIADATKDLYGTGGSANDVKDPSAQKTLNDAKTAYDAAPTDDAKKKAYEDALKVVNDLKATIESETAKEAAADNRLVKANADKTVTADALTKANNAKTTANNAVTTAKNAVTTAEGNIKAADGTTTLTAARTAAQTAKTNLEAKNVDHDSDATTPDVTAAEAAAIAKTALDDAKKAVTEAEAAEKAAQEAYDKALEAAGDAVTSDDEEYLALKDALEAAEKEEAAAKAKLDAAKAKLEAAEKAAENGAAGDFVIKAVEGVSQTSKTRSGSAGSDEFTFTIEGELHKDDVIYIDLNGVLMDKTSVGKQATLDVESDDLNLDLTDLVYVSVEDYGITATTKKLATVAEDEEATLEKDLKIESTVGDFAVGQEIELKLNNGFEFNENKFVGGADYSVKSVDEDKAVIVVERVTDEITIKAEDMTIVADSAKSGDVATITVKALDTKGVLGAFKATAKVEVMKVVDYTVIMSVDEDEDLPLIYSGTDVDNTGITDDSDHYSLEVTVEESFPGAWSMRKGFNFELPDGVYVTDVDVVEAENFIQTVGGVEKDGDWDKAFFDAYQDGDHKNFEFDKRVFDDVNTDLADDEASVTFKLQLVADPDFHGDVTLKFTGDLVDEQEVTIAQFAPIAVVEAEQNDMKIDYRYTEIPTDITVTETAAGLWKEGTEFWMAIEKGDMMSFEDDATYEVTGGLEIDDFEDEREFKSEDEAIDAIGFKVEEESDEAATVTISNLQLFMQRNIPAGAYDLIAGNDVTKAYLAQGLFAPDKDHSIGTHKADDCDDECFITDVEDFSDVVKEAFVNVVTAGREQDDASFTTKVVVPVGESYIVAGENQVTLDVPAYVSAAGYTMLPVRAVATALGINNNNVIWNGETKTVTILYGQRIITMVAGQKTVNVNGSVIPASAAVEIVDGRTFLPMRDLATALGVTDITWDAATKTATLNGGVVAE